MANLTPKEKINGNYTTLSLYFAGESFPRRGEEYFGKVSAEKLLEDAARLLGCEVSQLVNRDNDHQVKVANTYNDSYYVEVDAEAVSKDDE